MAVFWEVHRTVGSDKGDVRMAQIINLAKLEEIKDLRTVWPNEASDFTPWLAEEENIEILASTLGIEITVGETESSVGDFNADIFGYETGTDRKVVIENQLEDSNHDHLGKLITYASGKTASVIIWLVKRAREEHRAAIEWLNNHTDDDMGFFLCEIKLYRIGNSAPAVKFEIIEKPNVWAKEAKKSEPVSLSQQQRHDYWEAFQDYAFSAGSSGSTPGSIPGSTPGSSCSSHGDGQGVVHKGGQEIGHWGDGQEVVHKGGEGEKEEKTLEFSNAFNRRKSSMNHWLYFSIGSSACHLSVLQIRKRSELYVGLHINGDSNGGKELFHDLLAEKENVEAEAGLTLEWEELPEKKASRIGVKKNVDFNDKTQWTSQFDWIMDVMLRLKKVFGERI